MQLQICKNTKHAPAVTRVLIKTVILKITTMASVRRDWQRNNGAVALVPKTKPGNSRMVVRFAAFVYN